MISSIFPGRCIGVFENDDFVLASLQEFIELRVGGFVFWFSGYSKSMINRYILEESFIQGRVISTGITIVLLSSLKIEIWSEFFEVTILEFFLVILCFGAVAN